MLLVFLDIVLSYRSSEDNLKQVNIGCWRIQPNLQILS